MTGVEIVAIGDELLLGDTVETNGAWLGRRLAAEGLAVSRRTVVGDDGATIRDAVASALVRTRLVICSGGLGPTEDDRTRQAVADLFGRRLVLDSGWLAEVEERFRERGLALPEASRGQALVPEGATVFPNARGTAPGLAVEDERGAVILLPGVPHEFRGLAESAVIPFLRARSHHPASPILSHRLHTTGIAESAVADRVADLAAGLAPLTLAYLPSAEGVTLRLTAWGLPPDEAHAQFERAAELLRERLGHFVYGEGELDLAVALGRELVRRGLKLATAESCTGGLIAKWLTDAAGASDFFVEGFVTYSDEAKQARLGVPDSVLRRHGAVSEATVIAMVTGAQRAAGTDCAIAITGIAGPGGGSPEKPVGTVWIAASLGARVVARCVRFRGDRGEVRTRSAQAGLSMLRDLLLETNP